MTSVRLVAHSLGTLIAQHFAARYPEQVVRLALLGINRAPVDARRQTLRSRAANVRAEGLEAIVDSVIEGGLSKETRRSNPLVEAFVRELLLRQSAEGVRPFLRGRCDFDGSRHQQDCLSRSADRRR